MPSAVSLSSCFREICFSVNSVCRKEKQEICQNSFYLINPIDGILNYYPGSDDYADMAALSGGILPGGGGMVITIAAGGAVMIDGRS